MLKKLWTQTGVITTLRTGQDGAGCRGYPAAQVST